MTTKLDEYPNRIREYRNTCGLTQKDLGEAVGMTGVSIGHLELGRRDLTLSNLRALAGVFGVAPVYLLSARDIIPPR